MSNDYLYFSTEPGMPGDNDHLEPGSSFTQRNIAAEEPDVLIEVSHTGFPLIITFGGMGIDPGTLRAQYGMRNFLKDDKSINYIFLRDQYQCWYHNGVQGISTNIITTIQWLEAHIQILKPSRIICAGSSGGGYAAILFGVLLKAYGVVALSPQTLLQRGLKCQAHGNLYLLKWTDGNGTWDFYQNPQYADLLDLPPTETKIEIICGSDDMVDTFHSDRMWTIPTAHVTTVPGDHPGSITYIRDSGMLGKIFNEMLGRE